MYEDLEALLRAPGRPNYAPDPYGNTLSMAPPPPRNGLGQQYDPQMDGRMQDYDLSGGDAGQSAYLPPPQPSPDPYAGMLGSGMASGASRLGMGAGRPSVRSGMPYQGATISPEANGSRPWDQFNTGLQPSPYMVKDNYMENGPVHTLGYSSRHGISQPTVDYSGMAQRAGIDRYNMDMSRMLGNQEIARGNANLDLQRMMLMSDDRQNAIGQRRQAEWDRMYTKTPAGQRASLIDRGEAEGHLPSAAAGEERISDMFSAASRAGKGFSKETGRPNDLEAFMRNVGQMYNPAKHDKYSIIRGLEGMGVTANTINALRGKPGMDNIINALIGDVQSVPMTRGAIDDFGLGLGRAFVPDISSLLR